MPYDQNKPGSKDQSQQGQRPLDKSQQQGQRPLDKGKGMPQNKDKETGGKF